VNGSGAYDAMCRGQCEDELWEGGVKRGTGVTFWPGKNEKKKNTGPEINGDGDDGWGLGGKGFVVRIA